MKLILITSLLLTIANAMVISKRKNEIEIENKDSNEILATPTIGVPTKTKVKRAKTTEYHEFQNITIFEEGWTEWDQDWFESSWTVPEGEKVFDGVIKVELTNNAGFSLQSKTLQSQYGFLSFDYKLSANDGLTRLNFISFDEGDYVNQGNYIYTSNDYEHVVQEIKNHNKNTFISSIKRFAWQNYGNEKDFTLYLKNIVYRDIKIEIKKYNKAIPIIDNEVCNLSPHWTDISESQDRTSFEVVDGKCVMKITSSLENPALFELKNRKFTGGKLEIEVRSEVDGSILTWYALNSENFDIDEIENASYSMTNEYQSFDSEDFETEDEYNTLKIASVEGEVTYEVIKFNFYPITIDENIPLYDVTPLEEPDVILDSEGLHWQDASWGSTSCEFQTLSSAMECSFEGKQGSWPGFGFLTQNDYNGGTLLINMKVQNPDQNINILSFDRTEKYYNVNSFKATTEYAYYAIAIPSVETSPTYKFAIQEASQQDNTYYIRSIVYYPPNIPLPGEDEATTKKTTTKTKTTKTSQPTITEPVLPEKTEEENFEDLGYQGCPPSTKIAYADSTGIYGLAENNEWCAILEKNIDKCWSILYGYKCCSENATIDGAWGMESDGTKCGNPSTDACWANEIDSSYKCCTRNQSTKGIVLVDESGAWGVMDDNWCGII
ncbi:hypothetical protein BCR36DRAFT_360758 [Piromyces finnis]|uniref:CBM10 domain-containing protein n=1 Tax=Piromyces finnis TaxID=1754191 RepID=A0A1Y1UYL5_9FUNG|nr:hypothetical protein BCR36DRAFT_360758 [Piromyces finnis]|eukprot:ORX43609.1 hypothetical protein BCR36DRAFT_360758 [Piromyces finnis]